MSTGSGTGKALTLQLKLPEVIKLGMRNEGVFKVRHSQDLVWNKVGSLAYKIARTVKDLQ